MKFLPTDFAEAIQDNVDSYIYTLDEKEGILDWLESLKEEK
jgi:hypothetical protein